MTTREERLCLTTFLLPFFCRISGGMALQRDIHASVSEQIKKNFYKAKWKVRVRWDLVLSSEKDRGGVVSSTWGEIYDWYPYVVHVRLFSESPSSITNRNQTSGISRLVIMPRHWSKLKKKKQDCPIIFFCEGHNRVSSRQVSKYWVQSDYPVRTRGENMKRQL